MAPGQALVPTWLVNLAALGWRLIAIAALVVVAGWIATLLWTVTASIAVAVVIAAVFAPSVLRLRENGRSRTAAAGIVWVVAIATVVGIVALLAIAFLPYVAEVVGWLRAGLTELDGRLEALGAPPAVANVARDAIELARSLSGAAVGGFVASAASAVTVLILASFLVFFFLRDGDLAWVWTFQAIGDQKRERITAAGDDALTRVGGYLRGTTVLSFVIAVTDWLFLSLLGVPLALPLAVLVFLAGYIPWFGGIVTTAILLLVTLAALGPTEALALLVLIAIRNVVLGYGLRPMVYGRTVRLHPALVLIALPAGFQLGGIVGLFAAVPVTAVVLAVASAVVAIVDPDPRPPLPGLVPAWVDRAAQWSWRLLVVVGLIGLLVATFAVLPLVLLPVLLATILAATLQPLVAAAMRRGWSRTRAAAVAVGGGALAVAAVLALSLVALVDQAGAVAGRTLEGARSLNTTLGGNLALGEAAVGDGAGHAVRLVASLAQQAAAVGVVAILSMLLAFYLLRDAGDLWGRATARMPPVVVPQVRRVASDAAAILGGYMFGTAAISLVGAASQLLIMVILGIPLALPVFVISFFLCFIPYIGGFVSTGIAFLLTVAFGSTADIVIMGIWTVVFNLVTGNIVGPLVYGRTVHIHPAIVLVAIPAGAAIAGVLGMFIVIPVLGVVAVTWRTVLGVMGTRAHGPARIP